MNSFYAYKPFTHQHVPEIEQELRSVGDWTNELVFMTHSLPVARGIFASIYVESKSELTQEQLHSVFAEFYRDSFFVRLVKGSPDINWVKTTNFCDLGFRRSRPAGGCVFGYRQSGERRRRPGGAEYESDVWSGREDRIDVGGNESVSEPASQGAKEQRSGTKGSGEGRTNPNSRAGHVFN